MHGEDIGWEPYLYCVSLDVMPGCSEVLVVYKLQNEASEHNSLEHPISFSIQCHALLMIV